MNSSLHMPTFTDKTILRLINYNSWSKYTSPYTSEEIRLKESCILVSLNFKDFKAAYGTPPFTLSFRDKYDSLIGIFTYQMHADPTKLECNLSLAECLFLGAFYTVRSYLSRTESIEKLMGYPDIAEWLLWNNP